MLTRRAVRFFAVLSPPTFAGNLIALRFMIALLRRRFVVRIAGFGFARLLRRSVAAGIAACGMFAQPSVTGHRNGGQNEEDGDKSFQSHFHQLPPVFGTAQQGHSPFRPKIADWRLRAAARAAKQSVLGSLEVWAVPANRFAFDIFGDRHIAPSGERPDCQQKAFDLQQHLFPRIGGFSGDARTGCGSAICSADSIRIAAASAWLIRLR